MAYKTKDVDDSYSESKWIFALILVQLEVVIVSVPLVVILREISTNGRYIGFVLIIFSLLLIIGPKAYAHYRKEDNSGPKRGASMGLRVLDDISSTFKVTSPYPSPWHSSLSLRESPIDFFFVLSLIQHYALPFSSSSCARLTCMA